MIGALLRLLGVEDQEGVRSVPVHEREGRENFRLALERAEEVVARANGQQRPVTWEDLFPKDKDRRRES